MSTYHVPVMASQALDLLRVRGGGIYVDATLGGGGHSRAIMNKCPDITLYGFDRDPQAIEAADLALADGWDSISKKVASGERPYVLINDNFNSMRTRLALQRVKLIDGIIFDLGVSSHQIDEPTRGFSFENDAPLDMRMDTRQAYNAWNVVNELPERQLELIFRQYGEEFHSRRIARAIVKQRSKTPVNSTLQLAAIIANNVSGNPKEITKSKARIFQSIRIHLNQELDALQTALRDAINILRPGGRIVVLSYHGLEDRMVKNEFRNASGICLCPPESPQCICTNRPKVKILTPRPLIADEDEIRHNARARSAKLRAAEKTQGES
ncbi:MAG: 16S rRNA (cytosine(1402)-N(4))-methyltransferase RsmH [Candidatus Cloacimonetes bacterium]|nr:16S rRNA (cytosine(1402)-N(4))-methyltransferase RsmH [Candidatus Cloacimonadota bacterium]